jgi:hypothetical protein
LATAFVVVAGGGADVVTGVASTGVGAGTMDAPTDCSNVCGFAAAGSATAPVRSSASAGAAVPRARASEATPAVHRA